MVKYITPAVTPLTDDGQLDTDALEALYEHLIRGRVSGILILGSIGEFFALQLETKQQLIREAARIIRHRVPLMVGISGMNLPEILALSDAAAEAGADAVISVPPYYFHLQQQEIEAFYSSLAEHVSLPLYLYNFPDRTGYSIVPETVLRLARRYPNIVGIKDTIAGMDHTREIIKLLKPEFPHFEVFSGFDDNFAHNALCGGDGCIAGLSNLAPELCSAWRDAVNRACWSESAACQQRIDHLMDIYAVGSPFVPFIKEAMALCGLPMRARATFPLPSPSAEQTARLRAILAREGLIAPNGADA